MCSQGRGAVPWHGENEWKQLSGVHIQSSCRFSNWFNQKALAGFLSSFFFNDTATPEIYTLSLHDALPIYALHRLRALGVVLVEVDVPGVVTLDQQAGFPIALFEANLDIPAYLAAEGNGITFDDIQRQIASPDVAGAIAAARGGAIPQAVYEHALNVVRPELQALYASYFADNGVAAMVFPTTVLPARPIGQDQTVELNGRQVDTFTTYIRSEER